jgi:tryptophan-rich sensory protein
MNNIFSVRKRIDLNKLLVSIAIALGTEFLSSVFSMDIRKVYANLKLPPFSLPPSVSAPIWTVLYMLIGYAAYRIWMYGARRPYIKNALYSYGILLVFSLLWSVFFFGFCLYELAFLDIVLLLGFIIITVKKFFAIDRTAGYVLILYMLWVVFAAIMNFYIWLFNR